MVMNDDDDDDDDVCTYVCAGMHFGANHAWRQDGQNVPTAVGVSWTGGRWGVCVCVNSYFLASRRTCQPAQQRTCTAVPSVQQSSIYNHTQRNANDGHQTRAYPHSPSDILLFASAPSTPHCSQRLSTLCSCSAKWPFGGAHSLTHAHTRARARAHAHTQTHTHTHTHLHTSLCTDSVRVPACDASDALPISLNGRGWGHFTCAHPHTKQRQHQ